MKKMDMVQTRLGASETTSLLSRREQAISLTRMLSFALEEARELGAADSEVLISQAIKNLKARYVIDQTDLFTPQYN
ncbi:MAG: hypothetical protein NW215_02465 [Hyphomicrobiales bacterium]|nr:hypothetical protein [Hyphomicrobiales bacterium]